MKREPVALAVDSVIRIDVGFGKMPLRTVALLGVVFFPALWLTNLPFLQGTAKAFLFIIVLVAAGSVGMWMREGVWIGTWVLYRGLAPFLPWAIVDAGDGAGAQPHAATVASVDGFGMEVGLRGRIPGLLSSLLSRLALNPRATEVEAGMFEITPGGWRGVLEVEPPAVARYTDAYGSWAEQVVAWLTTIGVPAQFYAVSEPFERVRALAAYDRTFRGTENPLNEAERELVGATAEQSLSIRHYVVLAPGTAGPDGIPYRAKLGGLRGVRDTTQEQVVRALERAANFASNHGIRAHLCPRDGITELLKRTPLLAQSAAFTPEVAQVGTDYLSVISATALPAEVEAGMVVQTLLEDRIRGTVSVYIAPVDPATARDKVEQIRKVFQRQARKNDELEAELMASSALELGTQLGQRMKTAHGVALTMDVRAKSPEALAKIREKLMGRLAADGLRPVLCGNPGMAPALAVAPGGTPLGRSLLRPLTTNSVVACLLPAMGTPYARPEEPYLGQDCQTGMPVYLNVFRGRDNMNLTCIGQMGKGKSVTMKSMLYRHSTRGIRIAVLDPHSEYQGLMTAIGGVHIELGEQSINPLFVEDSFSADEAASLVMPALSVMAGDVVSTNKQGYPVRRLSDEDKGWMYVHLAEFYGEWGVREGGREPILSNLVEYLRSAAAAGTTVSEQDRARRVTERLSSFTNGTRGQIFNRPMHMDVGSRSVAFGLSRILQEYAADATPALAVILGYLLREMRQTKTGLIVMIDEAHLILDDPDVSNVLNGMVRGVRKRGVGVWMASQQVEDFVGEDGLGKTLAANSETKIILGIDRTVADAAQAALGLSDAEREMVSRDCPRGRAVVISGSERAVVDIVAGPHLMWMVSTTSAAQAA